jgi:hypothetical protein
MTSPSALIELAAKVADAEAQRCREAVASCPKWSPAQAEWSRARDACLNIADGIRALRAAAASGEVEG